MFFQQFCNSRFIFSVRFDRVSFKYYSFTVLDENTDVCASEKIKILTNSCGPYLNLISKLNVVD